MGHRYKLMLCSMTVSISQLAVSSASAQTSDPNSPHYFVTADFSDRGLITPGLMTIGSSPPPVPEETTPDLIDANHRIEPLPDDLRLERVAVIAKPAPIKIDQVNWAAFQTEAPVRNAWAVPSTSFEIGTSERLEFNDTPVITALNRALSERDRAYSTRRDYVDFSATYDFEARAENTGLNVDLGFSPSAGWYEDGDVRVRRLGAEFRLGQDFDQRGKALNTDSWYIFAGASGEALVLDAGNFGFTPTDFLSLNGFTLRDRVTVGDIQAGVSIERWGGALSLSYVRREIVYGDQAFENEIVENFAGISFTLAR